MEVDFLQEAKCTSRVELPPNLLNSNRSLKDGQTVAVPFLFFNGKALFADVVGGRKTLSMIIALMMHKKYRKMCLIIGPIGACSWWTKEIKENTDLDTNVIKGTKKSRLSNIKKMERYFFNVTNYEAFLSDRFEYSNKDIDILVVEEADEIRNRESKTSIAIKDLSRRIPYRYAITATPVNNSALDLFSIMEIVEPTCLGDFYTFKSKYCIEDSFKVKRYRGLRPFYITVNKIVGHKNLDELRNRIEPFYIGRSRLELNLEMKGIHYDDIWLDMDPIQENFYNMARDGILKTAMGMKRIELLEKSVYLQEIACSPELVNKDFKNSCKLDKLFELLPFYRDKKIVIFSQYEKFISIIERELIANGYEYRRITGKESSSQRDKSKFWLENKIGGAIVLITAAAEKLWNLQAASYMFCMDRINNPQRMKQVIGRIYRSGQENSVLITNFFTNNTVDGSFLNMIIKKAEVFYSLFSGSSKEITFSKEELIDIIAGKMI